MRHLLRFRPLALAVTALMLGLSALIPTTGAAAQGFPPNVVVSTYFDARFCGNGLVSIVTDAGGALINVCTSTGQRIIPPFSQGYSPYQWYGFNPAPQQSFPPFWNGNQNVWPGWNVAPSNPYLNYTFGYNRGVGGGVQYTYTDTRTNCPNGSVTATSSGYFCSANGVPAFVR